MFRTVFYIFRPSTELNQLLDSHTEDWTCLLNETIVWSREESPEINFPAAHIIPFMKAQMKLLFLTDLVSDYFPENVIALDDFQSFLSELIGYPSLRVETFDRWWSLERVEGLANTFEDAEKNLSKQHIDLLVSPSVFGIREWMENLKQTE